MAALGLPTTRALAAVLTGETVIRETLLPGAVLTRVASSHIRIGTFQFFAARSDVEGLRLLADYVIARHYPRLPKATNPTSRSLTGHCSPGRPYRPLALHRLHPRSDEHRQHVHRRRDD